MSRAHIISVFAALHLPGEIGTVLYALRWFPHISGSVFVGDAKCLSEASKL